MKLFQIALPILLQLFQVTINAQSLSPSVISTSGGFHEHASGMLSFTVGEMAAVETLTSTAGILTQGFQQYWDFGTSLNEHPNNNFSLGIYPNPSSGYINLLTESEVNEHVNVTVLDLLGKEILQTSFYHQRGINIESIDLTHVTSGIYVVVLSVTENNSSPATHWIRKINIIK